MAKIEDWPNAERAHWEGVPDWVIETLRAMSLHEQAAWYDFREVAGPNYLWVATDAALVTCTAQWVDRPGRGAMQVEAKVLPWSAVPTLSVKITGIAGRSGASKVAVELGSDPPLSASLSDDESRNSVQRLLAFGMECVRAVERGRGRGASVG